MKRWGYSLVFLVVVSISLHALSLKDGLKIALENDKEIQTKNNSIEMILEEIHAAEGMNYPKLDFASNVQREKLTGSRISANDYNRRSYDWEFILRQPLYDGHDAKNEEALQRARYESAKYYMLESANAIALQYIEAYLNVLREKALMEFSEESHSINHEIFEKNKKKFDKGFATRLEFERSNAKFNESIANKASQRMNFEESIITLRNFLQMDINPQSLSQPFFNLSTPKSLDAAMLEAFSSHPSVKVSDNNINVAMYEYKRDSKRFHPTVDLVARYGGGDEIPGLEQPTNDYSVGLEMRYNLYNGGRDIALSNKAQKYIDEKRILSERARQQIENRLRLAWNAYTLNNEKMSQMKTYADSKKAVLETTMIEYDLGTADLNLLLTTEDEYIVAKKSMISTARDLLLSQYRIREAIGDVVEKMMLSDETLSSHQKDTARGLSDKVNSVLHVKGAGATLEPELLRWNDETKENIASGTPNKEKQSISQCYKVTSTELNVRLLPNTNSPSAGKYIQGDIICGITRQGNWVEVNNGWVSNIYLEAQKNLKEKHYCFEVGGTELNVRKEPNTKSDIIRTYQEGQIVCGSSWENIWLKVNNGWVSNAYLKKISK